MGARRIPQLELIALLAGLMSLAALAIDVMLPALPAMGAALGVTDPNDRQLVVVGFVLGMGFGQLVFGPLSDRFGRRRVLISSLLLYAAFGAACAIPGSFEQLVAFRALQGMVAAGARVVAVSLVRDLFEGAQMARVMSWVMMVFMAVPILAPNIGYAILQVAPWPAIFWTLVVAGVGLSAWAFFRLPETLPPEKRRSIAPWSLCGAYLEVVRHPVSRAYTLALGFAFGSLFAFISSSEQVFAAFGHEDTFTFFFAGVAGSMMVASFVNARLVERVGPRVMAHRALAVFVGIQAVYVFAYTVVGVTGFVPFYVSLVSSFFCFSLIGANFNAMAMQPLGHVAGTASAALGFVQTTMAGTLGGFVARQFDGTPLPIALGFLALSSTALVMATLGRSQHRRADVAPEPQPAPSQA